jgi:hypothetical protein
MSLAEEDVDTQPTEAIRSVDGAEVGAESSHTLHDGGEVARAAHGWSCEARRGVPGLRPRAGCAEHGLGRNASIVEAVAPQEGTLDQRDPSPQCGTDGGAYESTGPAAQDQEIIAFLRSGVGPSVGAYVFEEPAVGLAYFFECHAGKM